MAWLYEITKLPTKDIALKRIGEQEEPLFTLRISRDVEPKLADCEDELVRVMFEAALEYLNGSDKDFYDAEGSSTDEEKLSLEFEELMPAIH